MAERRMFNKRIIDSDAFLDMPPSTQALYFHLGMRADDDGFLNNPKKIQRTVGAQDDDMKILLAKRFLIPFDSGIVVIKHWRMHNYIAKDRYKPTAYLEEKSQLTVKDNGAYTECIQDVNKLSTQIRLGKVRLDKDREDIVSGPEDGTPTPRKKFMKPSIQELSEYCKERRNAVSPEKFIDYYESNGWRVGRNPMKDWKAAVRTWERNGLDKEPPKDTINGYKAQDAECPVCGGKIIGTLTTCMKCGYTKGDDTKDPENQAFYKANLERSKIKA